MKVKFFIREMRADAFESSRFPRGWGNGYVAIPPYTTTWLPRTSPLSPPYTTTVRQHIRLLILFYVSTCIYAHHLTPVSYLFGGLLASVGVFV